jgi:hypothetical protein
MAVLGMDRIVGIEAAAVVLDRQRDGRGRVVETEADGARARMANRIGHRLLTDTQKLLVDSARALPRRSRDDNLQRDTGVARRAFGDESRGLASAILRGYRA